MDTVVMLSLYVCGVGWGGNDPYTMDTVVMLSLYVCGVGWGGEGSQSSW